MRAKRILPVCVLLAAVCACASPAPDPLDPLADGYVRLALAAGRHDANYVDAYFGPPEWKREADAGEPVPIAALLERARELLRGVRSAPPSPRREVLEKLLAAAEGFLKLRSGERMSFAEEARVLFDVDPPVHSVAEFEAARSRLDALLPGAGPVEKRAVEFRKRSDVPADRLPALVDRALEEARRRTGAFLELPPGESFEVAFVKGKPWGAYNWYLGGYRSRIEFNTDLPTNLDSVFRIVAHEGYPGHHASNSLLEKALVREKGWREYSVSPLYAPISLLGEGTANAGIEVVLTEEELFAFTRDVLAPLAGLAGLDHDLRERVRKAREPLKYVDVEAGRMLLDEGLSEDEVVAFLMRYDLVEEARAKQTVRFLRTYRSYVVNYTAGEDLVKAWIGNGPDRTRRFAELLVRPVTPSRLAEEIRGR